VCYECRVQAACADNNEDQDLPCWFTKRPEPRVSESASRQDTYTALNLYQSHVKFTTTILLSILAVSLALLTQRQLSGLVARPLEQAVATLLLLDAIIGCASVFIVTRYYNVYVSELIVGAQLHYALRMRSYEWYERLIDMLKVANAKSKEKRRREISRRQFMRQRTRSLNDSHFAYSFIISLISFVCAGGALWLWQYKPFSDGITCSTPFLLSPLLLLAALAYVLLLMRLPDLWEDRANPDLKNRGD